MTPIVGPGTQQIQPIWVEDVAAYFAASIDKAEAANRTFELGGPDVVSWNEFWARLKESLGTKRPSIHLPFGLMRLQAAILERLPNPPVTRDQLKMLQAADNVVTNDGRRRDLRRSRSSPRRAAPPRGLSRPRETNRGPFAGPPRPVTSLE